MKAEIPEGEKLRDLKHIINQFWSDRSTMDAEILRKQIMVSQFVNAVGCTPEQATQILQSAQWHSEVSKVNQILFLFVKEGSLFVRVIV